MQHAQTIARSHRQDDPVPAISVVTPTWNRASYLPRVWEGLRSQTFRDFEWIVANDGSSDETAQLLAKLAAESPFPVVIISASRRIGKARLDNESIRAASGELIVWNDSDDYLLPDALRKMYDAWLGVASSERANHAGVLALCDASNRTISVGAVHSIGSAAVKWNDLAEVHQVRGDMLQLVRADLLKSLSFPEVDFIVPEGAIWTALGHMKVRVLPEVLAIKEYQAPNAVSFSGKQEYCRGRAHAMAISERNLKEYRRPFGHRLWRLITFIRCSFHGEIPLTEQRVLWGSNTSTLTFTAAVAPASLLALKDRLQGKVRRTHRDFLEATKTVEIRASRYGPRGARHQSGTQ